MNNKNQHIPAGYKSSPLGIIPEDWEVKRIGDFAPLQRGFDLPTDKIITGHYPVVYSNGIMNYHHEYKVKGPGVVTGRSGTIGKVTFVESDYWPHNTSLWVTNFNKNNPKFVYYLYKYLDLSKFASGSGVPTLNRNDVHSYKIAVPPLPEQQRIVSVLSLWDTAISKQTALIDKLTLRKRGLMQQLLTGKKRLKGFEGEWKEVKLGEIATFFSGGTPKSSNKSYYNGDIPFIRSGEIDKNKTELFISQEGINNSSAKIVEKGDILYALYGATSGQCSMSKIRGAINQAILCIKPNANRYFIMSVLQLNKENYYNSYLQGGQGNLSGEIVSNYIIPIPTNEEQNVIASILIQADKEIELADEKLTQLQEQKKGLMQVLLTGKRRVRL